MRTRRLLTAALAAFSLLTLAAPAATALTGPTIQHHCKGCPDAQP
ncbi:MAG TPA: hypothetical protein VHL53_06180 [Acidimicrobiia bacterium]|nr:hypothetical protein [Acidimicrobiia bacterium]